MYYKALLYILPLPLVVFIWNTDHVDIDAPSKLLVSIILVLLTVGGYLDMYLENSSEVDDE